MWRSILGAKKLVEQGIRWRVDNEKKYRYEKTNELTLEFLPSPNTN